jgi:hypothetical protein
MLANVAVREGKLRLRPTAAMCEAAAKQRELDVLALV